RPAGRTWNKPAGPTRARARSTTERWRRETISCEVIYRLSPLLREHGHGNLRNNLIQDGGRRYLAQPALRPQDQPVAQHRNDHALDIVRQDIVAAGHGRERLGRAEERNRGARTAAQMHIVMLARPLDDLEKIAADLVID